MSLKDKLLASYIAFEDHLEDDSPIHDMRNEAIKIFENNGFPSRKEEAWKYTSLNSILKNDYSVFPKLESTIEFKDHFIIKPTVWWSEKDPYTKRGKPCREDFEYESGTNTSWLSVQYLKNIIKWVFYKKM